jgi:acetylglutamate kinase
MMDPHAFSGRTFVLRIDEGPLALRTTLADDLAFLMERRVRPIVVAPTTEIARGYVRALNRQTSVAVGLSGADAALLPAAGSENVGRVQTHILLTLTEAGYIPVIEPTALGMFGDDVLLGADDVACAIAAATEAVRAIFFHESGGVIDPESHALVAELTPAEALDLAEAPGLDAGLRTAMRAAARGVRAGVGAAQIIDGRVSHASIVEVLTAQHLGTQVAGTVYVGPV